MKQRVGHTRMERGLEELEGKPLDDAAPTVASCGYAADLDEANHDDPRHVNAVEIASDFQPPALRVDVRLLEAHFASEHGSRPAPIRNYHREKPVPNQVKANAKPASVLVPIVQRESGLSVVVTRRDPGISYAGQVCYPGGRADPSDADAEATALREAEEEIGLPASSVQILGRLGVYHTQTGYRITPIVGLIRPPLCLVPAPGEVSEIHELPLEAITNASSYRIWRTDPIRRESFYAFEHGDVRITGPTVCMTMGFYEALTLTWREFLRGP